MNKYLKQVLHHGNHCRCRKQEGASAPCPQPGDSGDDEETRPSEGFGEEKGKGKPWSSLFGQSIYDRFQMGDPKDGYSPYKALSIKDFEPFTVTETKCKWTAGNGIQDYQIEKDIKNPELDKLALLIQAVINKECGNGIYESPRFDHEKLVKGIMTKSLSMSKIRKEEMQRKRLLVLNDVSGSCSQMCNGLAAACYKLITHDPRIVLIFTSDDAPGIIVGEGVDDYEVQTIIQQINGLYPRGEETCPIEHKNAWTELWGRLLHYLSIKSCLGFGDDQGQHAYFSTMAAGVEFFYMGNSRLTHIDNRHRSWLRETFHPTMPKFFATGIDTPEQATEALMDYLIHEKGLIKGD